MKILLRLLAFTSVILLTTSNVWAAASDMGCLKSGGKANGCSIDIIPTPMPDKSAPEIDAASATVPLALLTGVILLMKERTRTRRSSDSDK